MREAGHYWVRLLDQTEWTVGFYYNQKDPYTQAWPWLLVGDERSYGDEELVVGDKIPYPGAK